MGQCNMYASCSYAADITSVATCPPATYDEPDLGSVEGVCSRGTNGAPKSSGLGGCHEFRLRRLRRQEQPGGHPTRGCLRPASPPPSRVLTTCHLSDSSSLQPFAPAHNYSHHRLFRLFSFQSVLLPRLPIDRLRALLFRV